MTMQVANGQAVAKRTASDIFKDLLNNDKTKSAIAAVLPRHLTPDRIVKVALGAVTRTPLLLKCTPQSFLLAVVQAAELGLEPGSALGHAYLVPFLNSYKDERGQWQKRYECQMIPGYRGLIALARRSGEIASIEAHPVYTNDKFEIRFGMDPKLDHVPCLEGDPGKLVLVYAVAKLKDGGVQIEVMTRAQVDAIRGRSKQGSNEKGPWANDYDEMARKTVVRRIFKYLPVSIELASALDAIVKHEGDADMPDVSGVISIDPETGEVIDGNSGQPEPAQVEAPTRTESVKQKLAQAAAAHQPEPAPVLAETERQPGDDEEPTPEDKEADAFERHQQKLAPKDAAPKESRIDFVKDANAWVVHLASFETGDEAQREWDRRASQFKRAGQSVYDARRQAVQDELAKRGEA